MLNAFELLDGAVDGPAEEGFVAAVVVEGSGPFDQGGDCQSEVGVFRRFGPIVIHLRLLAIDFDEYGFGFQSDAPLEAESGDDDVLDEVEL